MSLPPVVERELRVASRKSATYWGRTAAAASGVGVLCFVLIAHLANLPLPIVGQITFRLLASITAITMIVSVLQLASDAFAREKREETLGLLFLTPLRPMDMVIGKLASTSLSAFYRFLAMVPVLAVPMLAGGVSITDFLLLVVGLLNLIFLGATLGLWVSAKCWDEKRAATWASAIMIALVAGPAVIWLGTGTNPTGFGASVAALSPAFAIGQATIPSFRNAPALFGSLLWTQLLGWFFFRAACRTLPHCWQKQPEKPAAKTEPLSAKPKPLLASEIQFLNSSEVKQKTLDNYEGRLLLDHNPIAWFASRWRPPMSATWGIVAIAAIVCGPGLLGSIAVQEWIIFQPVYALIACFVINVGIKTSAAHLASFAFARDRGEDTLDLLLSTPIKARELIDGHLLALRKTLRPVLQRAFWFEGSWLAISLLTHLNQDGRVNLLCLLAGAAMLGLLVADCHALFTTAMWQSVIMKNAREAQHDAFTKIASLPWLVSLLLWAPSAGLGGVFIGLFVLILSWTAASVAADIHFSKQARENLQSRLNLWAIRRAAGESEHYDGWKNLGRRLGRWWSSRHHRPQADAGA